MANSHSGLLKRHWQYRATGRIQIDGVLHVITEAGQVTLLLATSDWLPTGTTMEIACSCRTSRLFRLRLPRTEANLSAVESQSWGPPERAGVRPTGEWPFTGKYEYCHQNRHLSHKIAVVPSPTTILEHLDGDQSLY